MPKVSVIVPNYNHERFLVRRLSSVFEQTFQNFEVIFLDDASSDNSVEVMRQFAQDPRLKIILNSKNSGSPFAQWQKGLEIAKGDYVWIAESDDYCDHDFLYTLVNILDQNNDVGLTYCSSILVDDAGSEKGIYNRYSRFINSKLFSDDFCIDGVEVIRKMLVFQNIIPNASAVVFRKSLVKGFNAHTTFKLAGDWFFWLEILRKSKVCYLSNPINYFRIASAKSQRIKGLAEGVYLLELLKIYKQLRTWVDLSMSNQFKAFHSHIWDWVSTDLDQKYSKQVNNTIRTELLKSHRGELFNSQISLFLLFKLYRCVAIMRHFSKIANGRE